MIETKDITKMVSHIIRRDKGIADTQIMHPAREWFTGLGITTLIVALGSWFCFYLYISQSREMQKEVVITEQAIPYQAATVKNALDLFAAKQKKLEAILGGDMGIVMPVSDIATTTATSTEETTSTSTTEIPEMIIDPPPLPEDVEEVPAMLAP